METVRIYNPSTDNFTTNYCGKPYTINALDMAEFPVHIANHIKKHLANEILNRRGIKLNPTDDLAAIFKEIEVDL